MFGSGAGERIGIGAEWERLAPHLHLIFDFLKKLEIELKVSSDHMRGGGEVMRGNGLGGGRGGIPQFHGVTLENVKGFVQICKQVCLDDDSLLKLLVYQASSYSCIRP